jgi:hypothetical protein
LPQRLGRLGCGFRIHEVGHCLSLSQIHPTILKGPSRELTRIGRANAQVDQGPRNGFDDRPATVEMQLGRVLS